MAGLAKPSAGERPPKPSTGSSKPVMPKPLRRPVETKQYAADDYEKRLADAKIAPSMSRKGNCPDNAPMENFFHTLDVERAHRRIHATRLVSAGPRLRREARRDLFAHIEGFYNSRRLRSGIGYRLPAEMERIAA
jgi:transposase InsO family protein